MKRLGELALEIVYVPGKDNVAADALSHFGFGHDHGDTAPTAAFDVSDVSLHG